MRTVFLLTFLANLVLGAYVYLVSPDTVAIHFGSGGVPDNWASPGFSAMISGGVTLMLFLLFWFIPQLVRKTPMRLLSLPNRDYWASAENRDRMIAMLSGQMYQFGTMTFILMFVIGLLVYQANSSEPVRLREDLFLWALGIYMVYVIVWTVNLFYLFRIPKQGFR